MNERDLADRIADNWPGGIALATTAALTDAGIGPRLLTAGVKHGLLLRLRHGAYVRMSDWVALSPWEKDMTRLRAHAQATGRACTYSHLSAARLLGLHVWNAGSQIHVTKRTSVSAASQVKGVTVHRRDLAPAQLMQIRRRDLGLLAVTSLEQTIVDCARTLPFVTAVVIGDSGLHRGADIEILLELVQSLHGRRGVAAARKVIASLNKGSESVGETRTRLIIAGMDIRQPEYQLKLRIRGNEYRVDGAWRDLKLALEFDGKTKYFDFRPTDEAIYAERLRERELMEVGWSFIRVVWEDLANPEILRHRILAAMRRAEGVPNR